MTTVFRLLETRFLACLLPLLQALSEEDIDALLSYLMN